MNRLLMFLFISALIMACEKTDEYTNDTEENGEWLVFSSLTAEKDTIPLGGSTKITAIAAGSSKVSYEWTSPGTILGSGNEVTYIPTCEGCGGDNWIFCTAFVGKISEEKRVIVFVIP